MKNNFTEVGNFYEGDIAKFFEVIHKRHMHVPYIDDPNINIPLAEASKRMTDFVVGKFPVNEGEIAGDIGCGFGISTVMLAKLKKCEVYGITASNYQKNEAEKLALQENVSHLTHFMVSDATNTSFENEKFDAILFFESIFHMGHEKALREARRILKPNGWLLIADFIGLPSFSEADKKFIFETFQFQSLKTFEEYPDFLSKNGFELISMDDLTQKTIKKRKGLYIEALNTYREDIIKIGGSVEFYQKMKDFWAFVNDILDKHVGYAIVMGRKR